MNVYKMSECDWVAAESPGDALRALARETGCDTIYELVFWNMVDNEIEECSLDEEMFIDLTQQELGKTTFRVVIEERLVQGNREPFIIASTEY